MKTLRVQLTIHDILSPEFNCTVCDLQDSVTDESHGMMFRNTLTTVRLMTAHFTVTQTTTNQTHCLSR